MPLRLGNYGAANRNDYFTSPYNSGLGDTFPAGGVETQNVIQGKVADRDARIDYLWNYGEIFFLPLTLAIGTTPAAGTQVVKITAAVDFDLLVLGAHSDLALSSLEIRDSARQRLLTNSAALFTSVCTVTKGSIFMDRGYWARPYLLPARSQFTVTVTADGTESNGTMTFIALQPPSYSA